MGTPAVDLSRLDTASFYNPWPKQNELHTSPAIDLLAIGGNGSGKSAFLLGEAIFCAIEFPGSDCLLLRKNYPELEKGLILDLKNTVPAGLYRYNDSKHIATWPNGSHTFFGHCVAKGTLITTINGLIPVEKVKAGEFVLTRHGYHRVKWSGQTGVKPVIRLGPLRVTAEHRIFLRNGWTICQKAFIPGSEVLIHKSSYSAACRTFVIREQNDALIASTSRDGETASKPRFMSRCGRALTDLFRQVTKYITRTSTQITTIPRISKPSRQTNTVPAMPPEQDGFAFLSTSHLCVDAAAKLESAGLANGGIAAPVAVMPVYDLEVENQHEFFADGILVHNCKSGSEKDLAKYLSSAFVFIGIDEIGQFSYDAFSFMGSRNRINKGCRPNVNGEWPVPRMGGATNPMGPGYGWIKKLWIEKKPVSQMGKDIEEHEGRWYSPITDKKMLALEEIRKRVTIINGEPYICVYDPADYAYVHSTVVDNPAQLEKDPDYINKLMKLAPALRAKALYGDLKSIAGTYFSNFTQDRHVLKLPDDNELIEWQSWQPRWIGIDWGLAHWSAVFWATKARVRKFIGAPWRQVTVIYRELIENEKSFDELAQLIVEKTADNERATLKHIYLSPERFARSGERDPSKTIGVQMGLYLKERKFPMCEIANDRRVDGAVYMYNAIENDELIILDSCPGLIGTLEVVTRDEDNPEDVLKVDGAIEDDIYDGCRYAVLSEAKPRPKTPEVEYHERLERIQDPMAQRMFSLQHHMAKKNRFKPVKPRFRP